MKQILQNLSNGETELLDVPCPSKAKGFVLIQTTKSLISKGTEKMLIDFGKANIFEKAQTQPEKVKDVFQKIKNDGIIATYDAVSSKLNQPLPIGYCNVGKIIDPSDTNFSIGDRVVSNGNHSEIVRVGKNLVAKIPDNVDDRTASFTVISSIALQGIRLLQPAIGERVVVIGLGLIGLLAIQILKANGCKVVGVDLDSKKCELAKSYGAEIVNLSGSQDSTQSVIDALGGYLADGVLIAASTSSNEVIKQAAELSRKRGKIVLVGVIGLNINRNDFYEKELTFQVSCSYGPGRYDQSYEQKGIDYPYPYVRWTEQRNFEAVLQLMDEGKINVEKLISHTFDLTEYKDAYSTLENNLTLGVILDYDKNKINKEKTSDTVQLNAAKNKESNLSVSFLGAGNYASRVLMPLFKKKGALFETIVTDAGINSSFFGKKFKFLNASTNQNFALNDKASSIVIATRHNLHANQVVSALRNKKDVFVEKPLAINKEELEEVKKQYFKSNKILMVGFNRRFSKLVSNAKEVLSKTSKPKAFQFTMCPGKIPYDNWVQDLTIGGGRLIGEACHYIDLMRYLAGHKILDFQVMKINEDGNNKYLEDKFVLNLSFEDGSIGTINYFANGGKHFPKERIEIFCDNAALRIDNFISLKSFGWKGLRNINLFTQDKGNAKCVDKFLEAVHNNKQSPIDIDEIFEVAEVSINIANRLRN